MYRPVNPDRPFSGTSFAESFAKAYSDAHPEVEVGIIPCADGGTSLSQWQPGGVLFDNALNCAGLALRTSHLMGVLWHQGEGDCSEERYPLYRERFQVIMDALRSKLDMPKLPFVLGGLGDYLAQCPLAESLKNYHHVNEALKTIARENEICAFVSAEGLTSNPDYLHFNAASLKEFGFRYYDEYAKLGGTPASSEEPKEDASPLSEMELL